MFNQFGPVVKNLLLLNIALFVLNFVFEAQGIDLGRYLALYNFHSPLFKPYQLISHMFMHGGLFHLFFNMYALIMFGPILERIWGKQRFFIFYFSCGIFAGLLTNTIDYFQLIQLEKHFTSLEIQDAFAKLNYLDHGMRLTTDTILYQKYINFMQIPMVGASGAILGVLAAFAWLFPNTELQLIFPPIAVKAKWLIGIYVLFEVYMAFSGKMDGIGHWAHIGGAIMGTIFIFIWKQNKKSFY